LVTTVMVPVRGGEVWASDSGGDAPPIVLLHPGVGDSRIWEPMLALLTSGYRVIRYDARGFGWSPPPTCPYTLMDDLISVLDYFDLDRVPIVGCSQGGDTAIGLALAQPERVSALVLLCPGVWDYPWPPEPGPEAEYEAAFAAADIEALTAFGLRTRAAAGSDPAAVAQLRSAAQAWLVTAGFEQPNPPAFDRLAGISAPTSVLVGDLDRPALIACNEQIAQRIPGCRLLRVPDVDHLPPLRVPELIVDMIAATVAR
jgi:3-oxoadipate enol-lactonase